ncbi:MAG: aminotransferase class I/II-fold pyridoxal phosphate-dependent enzyme, partial [Chloroflexota bacterium]|nr:aminotransferase class I/II-fold pyridoxal phosphate-dependent enzyme [Chloroflexota bacterium]
MRNHDLDTISVDHLRRAGSVKWSTFPDCLGAWVAEMDFGTAPAVTEALQAAVVDACFGYLPISRREAMAAACAAWYQTACDWEVPAERIHPVPDVIKVMEVAIADYSPPGSKVIVPTPAYMPFLSVPQALGREIVEVPMAVVNGRWELDYAGIEAAFAGGGGLLILCNPLNPLGRVFTRDELCRVSEVVDAYDGRVFADEIHAPIVFPGHRHLPYASISDIAAGHTVTAISASKAWNIPGLKCAQIVLTNDADAAIWDRIGFMAGHGASTLGVIANAAAYRAGGEWLGEVMGYLDGNRGLLAEMVGELLPEVGHVPAEGTYLAWLDFRPRGIEAEDLGAFFREQARVAVVNGRACG